MLRKFRPTPLTAKVGGRVGLLFGSPLSPASPLCFASSPVSSLASGGGGSDNKSGAGAAAASSSSSTATQTKAAKAAAARARKAANVSKATSAAARRAALSTDADASGAAAAPKHKKAQAQQQQPIPPPSKPEAGASSSSAAASPAPAAPAAPRKKTRRARSVALETPTDLAEEEFFAAMGFSDAPLSPAVREALSAAAAAKRRRAEAAGLPAGADSLLLVFNPFTGRFTSAAAPGVASLLAIGFGIDDQRQLYVERPAELNALAARVRSGECGLPPHWPAALTRRLGAILRNKHIPDAAAAAQEMARIKINSLTHSGYASVVNANARQGEDAGAATAAAAPGESGSAAAAANPFAGDEDASEAIELNPEQQRVIDIALQGHHMYIGGSAGTGKTVLLRALKRRLQARRLSVAMTATTGVAGCHIGGATFHHTMGVSAAGDFLRRGRMLDHDVIVIDEVSMFPQRLFEEFDRVMREEAGTPELPFGGVQIILCGDFLQLGCINESSLIASRVFRENFVSLRLTTNVRQAGHTAFAGYLQEMRLGRVPPGLLASVQQLPPGTMVESAVNLLPTNKEVHAANEHEMERLEGDPLTLLPETGITALHCQTTETVLLRTEPNFDAARYADYVCGLIRTMVDLPRAALLSVYKVYDDGHAVRLMLPPGQEVAWYQAARERFTTIIPQLTSADYGAAVSEVLDSGNGLHTPETEEYLTKLMAKHPIAQPLTFKVGCRVLLRVNLTSNLVNGSIGTVTGVKECRADAFPEYLCTEAVTAAIERYRVFCTTECGMPVPMVPVVKFHSGEEIAVPPWEFSVGGGANTHYYSLSSVALPLSLAYAFTVHKVQGLTLVGRVHLELSRMWPCEHLLYVAMSRVRNPEQLSVSGLRADMVVANAECVAFDRSLPSAADITEADYARFPVSAWRRCNDTVYHLRRRGASLRHLLQGAQPTNMRAAAVGSNTHSYGHNVSGGEGDEEDEFGGAEGQRQRGGGGRAGHAMAVEQSVVAARRLRQLVRHAERTAKLLHARRLAQEREARRGAAGGGSNGSVKAKTAAAAAEMVELSIDGSDDAEATLAALAGGGEGGAGGNTELF